jgi:ribosomal protein S27E
MILESKFIEGTNNQYSIRNDGVIFTHYRYHFTGIVEYEKPIEKRLLYHKEAPYVNLCSNGKIKHTTVRSLLKSYFGKVKCLTCNNDITKGIKCQTCKNKTLVIVNARWRVNNPELIKESRRISRELNVETVSKSYVAGFLNIPVKELLEIPGLYEAAKTRILIKRKIKQIQNGTN